MAENPPATPSLKIRPASPADIPTIAASFAAIGWHKPAAQYERYLAEQAAGGRMVLIAVAGGTFAGYVTVVWCSAYPPFREAGIPEIVDLNVLPAFRRRGIGSFLLDEAERLIAGRPAATAGIAVGLYAAYGAAQRLYVRRGYLPDGRGLIAHGRPVVPGTAATVDDGLVLYFTKRLADPADRPDAQS